MKRKKGLRGLVVVGIVVLCVLLVAGLNDKASLELERDNAINENMELKKSLQDLEKQIKGLKTEVGGLQEDIEAIELEKSEVQDSLEKIKRENRELKELKEQLELEIIDLNERLEAKKAAESLAASQKKKEEEAAKAAQQASKPSESSPSGGSYRTMNVTAYSLDGGAYSPDSPYYGMTASGAYVTPWYTVAAGPSIPFGTRIYIPYFKDYPNGGIFVVQDRGGAVGDGNLDIYMESTSDAWNFGRRDLEVQFLD